MYRMKMKKPFAILNELHIYLIVSNKFKEGDRIIIPLQ